MDHVGRPQACSDNSIKMISRATKSQNFSAVFKDYETSTNQMLRSYHVQLPIYYVQKSQN